jgi:uncharacterized membrane protein YoaK (UPF0700 family)
MLMPVAVSVTLSFVAGYVDGCTFSGLFGLFVAQVTGSFVVVGAEIVHGNTGSIVKLVAIPVFFCAGVFTTVLVRLVPRARVGLAASLVLEILLLTGLLLVAILYAPLNDSEPGAVAAALLGVSAMGVQGPIVRLLFTGVSSTNVMTTNTTQIAIDATEAVIGWGAARLGRVRDDLSERSVSARRRLKRHLPLAIGFLAGTVAGVFAYGLAGFACLIVAIAIMLGLIGWAAASAAR